MATTVTVSEPSPGRGTVMVTVTLDRAAVNAAGGLNTLRSDLSLHDAAAAGWVVSGPAAAPGGAVAVTASHAFTDAAAVGPLVSQIAGPGVFRLALTSHRTFWHTTYSLAGVVDLRCGVGCFGDQGLKSVSGSAVGVDAGALAVESGQSQTSLFTFSFHGRLPGRLVGARAGSLSWTPQLGRVSTVAASSQTLNTGSVALVAGGGGGLVVLVIVALSVVLVRRRRKRRRPTASAEAVTPSS